MNRNLIEMILAAIWGAVAFFLYMPFIGIVFAYTNDIYLLLKHIPCENTPCNLRTVVFYATLIAHDSFIALPLFFIFGSLLGMSIFKFHLSRPLILSMGFFCAQFYYMCIYSEFGYPLPFYIEVLRALPIICLFTVFTKLGYSTKLKRKAKKNNKLAQTGSS